MFDNGPAMTTDRARSIEFQTNVEALGVATNALEDAKRALAIGGAGTLAEVLREDERLRVLASAQFRSGRSKDRPALVAATDDRIVVVWHSGASGYEFQSIDLAATRSLRFEKYGWRRGNTHVVEMDDGTSYSFEGLQPDDQPVVLAALIGGEYPGVIGEGDSIAPYPPGPRVASLGELVCWPDRISLPPNVDVHHVLASDVRAEVDTSGSVSTTRGRNLAAKGAGTLAFGPVGLFFMGNARETVHDNREVFLSIEGNGWSFVEQYPPELGLFVRSLAGSINSAVERLASGGPSSRGREPDVNDSLAPAPAGDGGTISQLERLVSLFERGFLTDEEFAEQKRRLLAS